MSTRFLRELTTGALAQDLFAFDSGGVHMRSDRAGRFASRLCKRFPNLFIRKLPLSNLLMGGEHRRSAANYARLTGDLLRPSTPIAQSPHAEFLREYLEFGDALLQPERFSLTRYFSNARRCIELFGQYFNAKTMDDVRERAATFGRALTGGHSAIRNAGGTAAGVPVRVQRIKFSDCFEIVDGNHRLALASVRGAEHYPCAILPVDPVLTPIQQMIIDSSWTNEHCLLYQPLTVPEVQSWTTVRRCTDRMALIQEFLESHGPLRGSYLDVGCSYGWFIDQMSKRGYNASGVDRDVSAAAVGQVVYGLDPSVFTIDDLANFLRHPNRRYDIVSCFSVLHHYVLGKGQMPAEEFIRQLDAITGSVLFLDTGESHEGWFKDSLKDWNAQFIEDWLRENTTFRSVQILGTDQDCQGRYQRQYGRHLFACYRS
ncbi:MAG TPA: methyltransferase domain-containing protein [Dongiaceae bacterium]|nr:methyltransferase domain-containing protein [Dongiaceae bacterium]